LAKAFVAAAIRRGAVTGRGRGAVDVLADFDRMALRRP
jgi:hypothetical protein